jgi:hypothetical protein
VTGVDAAAVDAVIGAWLAERARCAEPEPAEPAPAEADTAGPRPLVAVAVDGKTLRGAVDTDGHQLHLLAAATHGDQLVLGQVEVGAKTRSRCSPHSSTNSPPTPGSTRPAW